MSFEVKLKRLSSRDWNAVRPAWLPHVAQLSLHSPGQRPSDDLADFHLLSPLAAKVTKDGETRENLIGFRAAVLHEGVFLLHKAANVLVASQQQVQNGLPTWSIPTAYQSAFFSMEALLLLLGVVILEVENKTMHIDVWPEVAKDATSREKREYELGQECQIVRHDRIEHYHRWAILKRVLRTLVNSPVPAAVINGLQSVDDKDFARQRNDLHYSTTWKFDDMHVFMSPLEFCRFQLGAGPLECMDPAGPNFTAALAMTLLSGASSLLGSLGAISPSMMSEHNLLDTSCDVDRLPLRGDYELVAGNAFI